jgi:hypothetical protein
VYPFNPNAIDCRLAAGKGDGGEGGMTKPSEGGSGDQDETHEGESDDHGGSEDRWRGESDELGGSVSEEMHFDPSVNQRKEELYQRRFEERYDIYDHKYLEWLEKNHPESVPADLYTLVSASQQQ